MFEKNRDIFCQYPLEELIIHPRVQQDFYKGRPRKSAFREAYKRQNMPLIYNGDIFTEEDYKQVALEFPKIDGVMLGRGVLADPGLTGKIRGEEPVYEPPLRYPRRQKSILLYSYRYSFSVVEFEFSFK